MQASIALPKFPNNELFGEGEEENIDERRIFKFFGTLTECVNDNMLSTESRIISPDRNINVFILDTNFENVFRGHFLGLLGRCSCN